MTEMRLVSGDEEAINAIKIDEIADKLEIFLDKSFKKKLMAASQKEKPLEIKFRAIDKADMDLSEFLIEHPDKFFEAADTAIGRMDLPNRIKLRVMGLPETVKIRDLRSVHLGKFISVEGVVKRSSEIRPEITETIWHCPGCNSDIHQPVKLGFVTKPYICPSCHKREDFIRKGKVMSDARWITIEEPYELTEGDRPSQLTVVLKDDLVSSDSRKMTDPGNRVRITGIMRDIPKGKPSSVKLDFYLEANHVDPIEMSWESIVITKKDEKEILEMAKDPNIYERLVNSLAPTLYGMKEIKEAIMLQLFGGTSQELADGTKFRGDIHILIIGDPSAGKSQLLKLVPEIIPKGKYVSGKGVTGAGLTATVLKDELISGGWVLEAGALVLANNGLLAIDEYEKMEQQDQVAMHEAMEQGTISIAKASIVATLPARTSILAGGNPINSRFDPFKPISKQISIPDTLLSRFDLKFALRDVPNEERDRVIVDHVMRVREGEEGFAVPAIPADMVRKYIAYAKDHCKPALTKEAGKTLKDFYIDMRKKSEGTDNVSITLRQFEALVRLATASARVQLSDIIRREDAKRAIKLMRFSLMQLGYDFETGQIDVDRAEGATSSSERSKIRRLMEIIDALSEVEKEIKVSKIMEKAKAQNIDDVEEMIEKLKLQGILWQPNPGFVQKV
ncbi:MAG: minichromosome maintenance protein MCM [Candidatus Micrarchaeota archaeon]|nr:minichromosome maintenance protein MCM [Candidatus Micrarchaeota archaeon]